MKVRRYRSSFVRSFGEGGCPWRHHDDGIRMTLGNCLTTRILIVGIVGGKAIDGIGRRVAKRAGPRGTVDFLSRHLERNDLCAAGIGVEVKLTPGSVPGRIVPLHHPIRGRTELQLGVVDERVQRVVSEASEQRCLRRRGPTAQCRVARHGEINPSSVIVACGTSTTWQAPEVA